MKCSSILSYDECITPSNWDFPNITRPFSIIYYCLGGTAFYRLGNNERQFKKDHLYVLPANTVYSLREDPNDKFYSVYVHTFTSPAFSGIIEVDVKSDRLLDDLLELLRSYLRMPREEYEKTLIEFIVSYVFESKSSCPDMIEERIKKYIYANFVSVFKNSDISSEFNYSNSHLTKLFKGVYELTPKQYAERLVLEEITLLLRQDISISEISRRLDFSSPENLSRFFKTHFGCSPTEYIKKYKHSPI